MPCRSFDIYDLNEEVQKLTRIACNMAKVLRKFKNFKITQLSTEARTWMLKHEKMDTDRIRFK